jgi:hypothetical protein
MNIQKYLEEKLKDPGNYCLNNLDKKTIKNQEISSFILNKLLSKKYRKWKLSSECHDRTKNAVEIQVKANKPIEAIYFQGGYKLWRFPSSPNPDWAEFLNLSYVISYLAPIAAAYQPGVELTYYCHTLLMELHDNLTTEEVDSYMQNFQKLFDEFQKYLPNNFKIKILKDADIYPREEYFKALEEGKEIAKETVKTWSKEKKTSSRKMAQLNIKWKGREDWSNLSEEEKEQKLYLAALYEQAASSNLPKVMDIVKAPKKVLLFTVTNPLFIGIGSTKTSIAKHWVGYGVLEKDTDKLYDRILTPSQYEKVFNQPYKTEEVAIVDQENFKKIEIFDKRFNFKK